MALFFLFFTVFMAFYWAWVYRYGPPDMKTVAVVCGICTVGTLGYLDLALWTQ